MKKPLTHKLVKWTAASIAFLFMSATYADTLKVAGGKCPKGYSHTTFNQVKENPKNYCGKLATWDIARLANGGSMDGSGYQCKFRASDKRKLGHSLCSKKGPRSVSVTSLNQASWVSGTSTYKFGHNSIPNMKVYGAPADAAFDRVAMLHDRTTYRLYLFKKGSKDTLYQFGFNRSTNRYEYGYNSIKVLKIVGMPADANHNSFAMLHDGKDYRLYMRSKSNKAKIYQAAYKTGTNQYVYGYRSIPSMKIIGAPQDITNNRRWAMLHDGKDYRLYIGRKHNVNQFYQFAFNRANNSYQHGYKSIPLLTATGNPKNSRVSSFTMLHDGSAYRYYHTAQ